MTNPDRSLLSSKPIDPCDRLIFALDVPTKAEALSWIDRLGDAVTFYKLGLELFMAPGYFELVEELHRRGKKVFADLKFFDVPATVKSAVANLARTGVYCCTVHGTQSIYEEAVAVKGGMKLLAVTVLTSLDRADLDDLGFQCDVEELVFSRGKRALAAGCDGVISSGLEAARLRTELGEKLLIITPGIRPVENKPVDDQKRTLTLEQAFFNGADHVVVGRPIRQAPDPRAAAEAMQAEIRRLFTA
ncbi:MAG: orotidine-5-phosphate decarboxylase [Chthoniobacter sp.]|jgi:orotidine-5'-phosphate decarboxylase|nr:orotidine-5-phosphate decarboxylase [Chthoniobacter sp.]